MKMIFCEKLRTLLEERELTQKKLAQDLCIAVSTMGGYVQGTSEPDFDTLKRIAEYFDVSADYLLNIRIDKKASLFEEELLRVFRSLPFEQQEIYLEQGKAMIRLNSKKGAESLKFGS